MTRASNLGAVPGGQAESKSPPEEESVQATISAALATAARTPRLARSSAWELLRVVRSAALKGGRSGKTRVVDEQCGGEVKRGSHMGLRMTSLTSRNDHLRGQYQWLDMQSVRPLVHEQSLGCSYTSESLYLSSCIILQDSMLAWLISRFKCMLSGLWFHLYHQAPCKLHVHPTTLVLLCSEQRVVRGSYTHRLEQIKQTRPCVFLCNLVNRMSISPRAGLVRIWTLMIQQTKIANSVWWQANGHSQTQTQQTTDSCSLRSSP